MFLFYCTCNIFLLIFIEWLFCLELVLDINLLLSLYSRPCLTSRWSIYRFSDNDRGFNKSNFVFLNMLCRIKSGRHYCLPKKVEQCGVLFDFSDISQYGIIIVSNKQRYRLNVLSFWTHMGQIFERQLISEIKLSQT